MSFMGSTVFLFRKIYHHTFLTARAAGEKFSYHIMVDLTTIQSYIQQDFGLITHGVMSLTCWKGVAPDV
jgi:hypothetical protein